MSCIWRIHVSDSTVPARLFDVSKQIVGQMFVHGVNVLISDVVAHLATTNACVLYFLNILLDTTIGESTVGPILSRVPERDLLQALA